MRKTKGEARHLPRGVKLLSIAAALVLTCVLAVSLVGTSFAAGDYVHGPWSPVEGIKMSVTVPASELEDDGTDGFSEWEPTTEGDFTLTAVVASSRKDDSNHFNEKKRTLLIENTTDSSVTLKFQWSREQLYLDGSVTCSLDGALGTGTFNGTIPAHESVSLTVTSNSGDVQGVPADELPMQTVTLYNFSVVQADTYTLNLLPAEHGTYSASNGTDTVSSSEGNKTITYNPESQKITLQAPAADSGYKFYLWEDEYHTPLSTSESYTYQPAKGDSVRAVFVDIKNHAEASYHIGDANYYYWEDAMRAAYAAAQNKQNANIIVDNSAHSVTLPKDAASASRFGVKDCTYVKEEPGVLHYVIPSGVTLVVPYSSAYSTATDDAVNTTGGEEFGIAKNSNATGTAYATLTVPKGVALDVNGGGTLLVNAVQGSTNGNSYHSHVLGNYGKMVVGGTVNVYGSFYARGYVIDANHKATLESGERTGRIYAYPGAQVYQMLQITDWRGGTYTLANQSKVMPITMYYLQNIMVETAYQMGSSMSAQVVGAARSLFGYTKQIATVPLITNGDSTSLFVMKDAGTQFITRYDYQKDQLQVFLTNGTVEMNYLELKVGSALSVNTSTKQLAISDNMPITVKKGSELTINNGLKFLPGASLTVEEGAKLEISDGSNAAAYFYGKADYQKNWSYNKFRTRLGVTDIVDGTVQKNGEGSTTEPSGDAQLNLAGTLTVNGVLSFSTNHQSGLTATGPNAKIVVNTLPTTAQKAIKEANATTDVATSSAWQAPAGPMVNDGAVTAFEKGATYTAVPAENGAYNWTRYTLNVNYVDAADKTVSGLTPEKLYSANGTVSFKAPDGYAITNIQASSNSGLTIENATMVDDGKTKLANAVTDGCTDVNLSNITADGTITVTVKKYDHTVRWNFADAKSKAVTHTFMSYLANGETQAVREGIKGGVVDATGAVTIKTAAGADFAGAGSAINTGKDPFEVTVTGITADAVATVLYSAQRSVTWKVTVDGQAIADSKTEIKTGSEATYELKQDGAKWQTVETKDIICEDGAVTVKERANTDDDITVTGVYGDVTVNIAITTYAHKVSGTITTVNGETSTPKTITPFFTNETTYTPAPEGNGKYIVSEYRVTGGTLAGKAMQAVSTILPADANVTLTDKEVDIKLTFQSYVAVWQWNAAATDGATLPESFSYTEYLTDKPDGQYEDPWNPGLFYPQYCTLRSNGTEGWYYANFGLNYASAGIAYVIPAGQRYVLSSDQTAPSLTTDRGSEKVNDWECTTPYSGDIWSLELFSSQPTLAEDMPSATVTVNLIPYAYEVTFTDAKGTVLEKFCAAVDGTNAANGEAIKFCVDGGTRRFVKAYEITTGKGSPAINGVAGLKQDKVAIPMDPWNSGSLEYGCTLTGVEADTTVKLTLDSYEQMAIWQWTVGSKTEQQVTFLQSHQDNTAVSCYQVETSQFTKWTGWAYKAFSESATGYCPQFTIPAGEHYYISDAYFKDKVGADAKSCESYPSDYKVQTYSFTLVPYDASLTWSVDDGAKQYMYINNTDSSLNYNAANYNAATKTWTYYPADGNLVKSFTSGNCTVHPAADKLSLAVKDLQANSTVSIVTQTPATALEGYYMGDMSFEWVRNAAVYTFDADGTTASWKPVDSFMWRHAAGSKSFTVTDDGDTITVANGSIYFINSTSAAKTYTIKLERTDRAANSALKLVVDGQVFEAAGDTVIIPAHTSQTVVCTLSGIPTEDELKTGEIGHITVTESNG